MSESLACCLRQQLIVRSSFIFKTKKRTNTWTQDLILACSLSIIIIATVPPSPILATAFTNYHHRYSQIPHQRTLPNAPPYNDRPPHWSAAPSYHSAPNYQQQQQQQHHHHPPDCQNPFHDHHHFNYHGFVDHHHVEPQPNRNNYARHNFVAIENHHQLQPQPFAPALVQLRSPLIIDHQQQHTPTITTNAIVRQNELNLFNLQQSRAQQNDRKTTTTFNSQLTTKQNAISNQNDDVNVRKLIITERFFVNHIPTLPKIITSKNTTTTSTVGTQTANQQQQHTQKRQQQRQPLNLVISKQLNDKNPNTTTTRTTTTTTTTTTITNSKLKSTLDIDECQDERACGKGAICENLPGSFRCACPPGFTGDPTVECIGKCSFNESCSKRAREKHHNQRIAAREIHLTLNAV